MEISNDALDIILRFLLVFGVLILIMIYLDYKKYKKKDDDFPFF